VERVESGVWVYIGLLSGKASLWVANGRRGLRSICTSSAGAKRVYSQPSRGYILVLYDLASIERRRAPEIGSDRQFAYHKIDNFL
jgi:hypothetical protein